MKMRCEIASRPGGSTNLDRAVQGPDFVIVLDGASPFRPVPVDTESYVDVMSMALSHRLAVRRGTLAETVADAIDETASSLGLTRGFSPSCALSIVSIVNGSVETFVLGDCLIAFPGGHVTIDDRLGNVAVDVRRAYRSRLSAGHGYDDIHRDLLRVLQTKEAESRNVEGGYWIAEATPEAAYHGVEGRYSIESVPWLVMATDGAYRPMRQLGIPWNQVAGNVVSILDQCHELECQDRDGRLTPRAKRHDDKTLAVVTI